MWLIDRILDVEGHPDNDAGAVIFRWALTFVFLAAALAGYAVADATPPPQDGLWLSPLTGAAAIAAVWIVARGGLFSQVGRRTLQPPRAMHLTLLPSDIGRIDGIDVLSYAAATKALEQEGFEWRGDFAVPEAGGAIFRLLVNPEARAYAELVSVRDYCRRSRDEFFEDPPSEEGRGHYGPGLQRAHPVIVSFFADGLALFSTAFPFDPSQGLSQRDAWSMENFRLLADSPKELLGAHLAQRRRMVREGKQLCTHVSERAYRDAMAELYWRATHAARTGRGAADIVHAA
jgi:hypothetical protein